MKLPALAVLALLAGPAAADGDLRDALSAVPAAALAAGQPIVVSYVGLAAAGGPGAADEILPAVDMPAFTALAAAGAERWSRAAGLPADDLRWMAAFGAPPESVVLWGLDAEAVATLAETLPERGFAPLDGRPGLLANGEPLRLDPMNRSLEDPWRDMLGRPSVVGFGATLLVQSPSDTAVAAALSAPAGVLSDPAVDAALAGLEQAADGAALREALLLSPLLGLGDPADLVGLSPEEAAERLAAGAEGGPPWLSAMMGDVRGPDGRPVLVFGLALADCAAAEAATSWVARSWKETEWLGGRMPADARLSTVESGGLCAASVALSSAEGRPYGVALRGLFSRSFPPLAIGGG